MTEPTGSLQSMMKTLLQNQPQLIAANKVASHSVYGFKAKEGAFITFLTPKQLAAHLQVSLKTLERMRANGSGPPFVKIINKTIRYPIVTLDAWVKSRMGALLQDEGKPSGLDSI